MHAGIERRELDSFLTYCISTKKMFFDSLPRDESKLKSIMAGLLTLQNEDKRLPNYISDIVFIS